MSEALEEPLLFCTHCRAAYRSGSTSCPLDGATLQLEETDPLLGTTIGEQYTITDCIAYGATSRVYRAHHTRLWRRELAIKVLLGDLTADLSTRMRFAQEAELLSRLDHANIVSIVDFARTPEGLIYLVMDLAHGPTLAELLTRTGPLPWRRAVELARQLARGLAHAHEQGIVHRDFKPDNVIVERAGGDERARIIDFGIALPPPDETTPRLTSAGLSLGTPAYASPEQAFNTSIDHRIDLFSLGVTFYEMLAGALPFSGDMHELLQLNAFHDAPPISERNPAVTVPEPIEQVVRRLMARDPEARYQTATEVLEALDEVLAELPTTHSALRAATTIPPTPLLLETQPQRAEAPRPRAETRPPITVSMSRRTSREMPIWFKAAGGVALLGVGVALLVTQLGSSTPKLVTSTDAMAGTMPATPTTPTTPAAMPDGSAAEVAVAPAAAAAPPELAPAAVAPTDRGLVRESDAAPRPARAASVAERARPPMTAAADEAEAGQPIVRPADVDPQLRVSRPAEVAAASGAPAVAAGEPATPATAASAEPPATTAAAATTAPAPTTTSAPAPTTATAPATAAVEPPRPTPTPDAATVPAAPPVAPPQAPAPAPARPTIMALVGHELQVTGSLSPRTVERAVSRVNGELAACAHLSKVTSARVRFTIDERGRAGAISIDGGGGDLPGCVRTAITALRTETPPDVGTVEAVLTLAFSAKAAP